MKVTIEVSEEELGSMDVSSEQLTQYVSDKIDAITVKKQKIIHQTELIVQVKVVNKK
jgi:hypothetical protein